jgi:hypothetical protein
MMKIKTTPKELHYPMYLIEDYPDVMNHIKDLGFTQHKINMETGMITFYNYKEEVDE